MYLLEDRQRPNRFLWYFSLRDWHVNNLTVEVFLCMHTSSPVVCMCVCGQACKWKDQERTLGVLAFPLVLTRVLVNLCRVSYLLRGLN